MCFRSEKSCTRTIKRHDSRRFFFDGGLVGAAFILSALCCPHGRQRTYTVVSVRIRSIPFAFPDSICYFCFRLFSSREETRQRTQRKRFWLCHFGIRLMPFWHKIGQESGLFPAYLMPFWHKRVPVRPWFLMPFWHSILYIAIWGLFILHLLSSSQWKIHTRLRFSCCAHFCKAKNQR